MFQCVCLVSKWFCMHRSKRSGRLQQNWMKLIFCMYEMRSVSDAKNVLQNAFVLCAVCACTPIEKQWMYACVELVRNEWIWSWKASCWGILMKSLKCNIFNAFGLQYWPIDIVVSWFISSLHSSTSWYNKRVNTDWGYKFNGICTIAKTCSR